jgi:hypothetical protein
VRNETIANEGFKRLEEHGEVGTMPLRGLAALLLLGGIVYALLSGNWGIGAIAFVLGLNQLRAAGSRPDRVIGWVLVVCGAFAMVDAVIWMAIGGA